MRKIVLIAIMMFAMLLISIRATADAAQRGRSRKRVLIGFKEGLERQTAESRRSFIRGRGGYVRRTYRSLSAIAAELSDSQISKLKADPSIAYIEEDGLVYALAEELPWGVDHVDAELVHPYNTGAGIKVAVIDTGIDLDHEDLNVVENVTFVEETTSGDDDHGHGTHCAGIIAALDNEIGVIGVAPGALLYAVKVLDVDGSGYLSDVAAGIDWAIENGMQIISLSLGTNFDYQTLRDACDRASAAGILIVAAAGNDYRVRRGIERDTVDYPARYESVIAVGAIDDSDTKAYFSSTGETLELVAPGVSINSTDLDNSYAYMTGTSMACPHVVGVAALVLSANPGADVRTVLQSTATDLGDSGWDRWYGYGLVNAAEAAGEPAEIHDIAVTAIVATPSTVIEGKTTTIDVTVENQGTFEETFDVALTESPDGFTDTATVTGLTPGASTVVQFSWNTTGATLDFVHTLTAAVDALTDEADTADNSMSTDVTVVIHDIAVTAIVATPSTVIEGDTTTIDVTVENQGTIEETFNVALTESPDGFTDTETVTGLAPGASTVVQFSWNTTGATVDFVHTLTAAVDALTDEADTADNSLDTDVTVVAPAPVTDIAITAVDVFSPVVQGDVVDISVTLENFGNQDVTSSIDVIVLSDNGTPSDSADDFAIGTQSISNGLVAGDSSTLTFTWDTSGISPGDHTLTASHSLGDDNFDNDSIDAVITVQEEPVGPEEFTFAGTVAHKEESRHTVSISATGIMSVNLIWTDRGDLRLRIYDPEGTMVAEADSSHWRNRREEIVIGVGPGDWHVAAIGDYAKPSLDYTIEGTISY